MTDEATKFKTALLELQGFARRNLERAERAARAAHSQHDAHHRPVIEADARYHEAHRVHQVIDMRVKEALQ